MKNWTAMPSVFPNGIQMVVAKTGWPIVAHNRYWSKDTDYAMQVSVGSTYLSLHVCTYVHVCVHVFVCMRACNLCCVHVGVCMHVDILCMYKSMHTLYMCT